MMQLIGGTLSGGKEATWPSSNRRTALGSRDRKSPSIDLRDAGSPCKAKESFRGLGHSRRDGEVRRRSVAAVWKVAVKTSGVLDLDRDCQRALIEAARNTDRISGLTHDFYRYPARFSPTLVRAAIAAFSEPEDLVLDPFMGGGTTLVEAMALGRSAIGTDISSLATFISEVKTTIYSDAELEAVKRWVVRATESVNMNRRSTAPKAEENLSYRRNLDGPATWRLRKAIEQVLPPAMRLRSKKAEQLARCVVLRTAQWALDGRRAPPSIEQFRNMLVQDSQRMISGALALRSAVQATTSRGELPIQCLNRPISGLDIASILRDGQKPKVIVTSPPYPGIHVLYHRWQVGGRRETPAPFWIANRLDGSGASYYTMGDRHATELNSYFDNIREALRSIAMLCTKETTVVQVVAFSDPSWQLPRYLSAADDAGFQERMLPALRGERDSRLWRSVPNRKWHANRKGITSGSQEVVLFHGIR